MKNVHETPRKMFNVHERPIRGEAGGRGWR